MNHQSDHTRRYNSLEPLETRAMLAAAPIVVIDGQRFKAFSHEGEEATRILIPAKMPKSRVVAASSGVIGSGGTKTAIKLAAASASPVGFQITLNITGSGVTDPIRTAFTSAAAKWESIITTDLPDVAGIDDIQIDASITPIDGVGRVLGQAGPSSVRTGSSIPVRGVMQFDSADLGSLLNSGGLADVIFHEMGHVLGIGTIWQNKGLKGGTATDPQYLGAAGLAAYRALGGTGNSVPLENTGGQGTFGAHWRESIFFNEVMTGYLNSGANPASILSVASLIDLGYSVNMAAAEAYAIPGVTPGGTVPSLSGSISGVAFIDTNNNGTKDDAEAVAPGRVIFLDTNNNGRADAGERFTTAALDGTYTFTNLAAGSHTVRAVLTTGNVQTTSTTITLEAAQAGTLNVGSFDPRVSISGTVFIDSNNNGSRDISEPLAPAKGIVYLDLNGNGLLDRADRTTTISTTGTYSFTGLTAGTYKLRVAVLPGVSQTTHTDDKVLAAGTVNTDVHLGIFDTKGSIAGTAFIDANNNGTRDDGELVAPPKTVVFLDANNDGIFARTERSTLVGLNGAFSFTGLLPGDYNIKLNLVTGISQSTTNSVTLEAAQRMTDVSIGYFDSRVNISGVAFVDANNNAARDDGEPVVARAVAYLDANDNGLFDRGERAATTSATGSYAFVNMIPGSYKLRLVLPSGFIQTTDNAYDAAEGARITSANLGLFNTNVTISGTVFSDANSNSARDTGELAVARYVVYLDANNNGSFDSSERSATTSTTGAYAFTGLTAGTHRLRIILPANVNQTAPASNAAITLDLAAGANSTNNLFGILDTRGSLIGSVFFDSNGNATRDAREPAFPGQRVFLDADNDGVLDTGETSVVTSSTGAYSFTLIPGGNYNIRVIPTSGSVGQSLPAAGAPRSVTLVSGTTQTVAPFGLTLSSLLPQ